MKSDRELHSKCERESQFHIESKILRSKLLEDVIFVPNKEPVTFNCSVNIGGKISQMSHTTVSMFWQIFVLILCWVSVVKSQCFRYVLLLFNVLKLWRAFFNTFKVWLSYCATVSDQFCRFWRNKLERSDQYAEMRYSSICCIKDNKPRMLPQICDQGKLTNFWRNFLQFPNLYEEAR